MEPSHGGWQQTWIEHVEREKRCACGWNNRGNVGRNIRTSRSSWNAVSLHRGTTMPSVTPRDGGWMMCFVRVTEKREGQCCSWKEKANDLHVHEAIHKAILPSAWSSLAPKPTSPTLRVLMYPPRPGQRPSHGKEEVRRSSNEMHDERGRNSETRGRRSCKKVYMRRGRVTRYLVYIVHAERAATNFACEQATRLRGFDAS